MRIRITGHGIYDGNGVEVPVGSEHEVKDEPQGWAGRYVLLGDGKGKTAVTNPKGGGKADKKPDAPTFTAEEREGAWTIVDGDGNPHGKPLTEDDAKAFNDLDEAEKAEFVAEHVKA